MTDEQLAFDIEAMIHDAAIEEAPEWSGAPLGFTTAYWPVADLEAAHQHWQFLHKLDQSRTQSRMWHRAIAVPSSVAIGEHGFDLFTADLRCEPWTHREPHSGCQCVGDLTYQAICEPHRWHLIASDENSAVEAWHDHAFTGWRTFRSCLRYSVPLTSPGCRKPQRSGSRSTTHRRCRSSEPPSSRSAATAELATFQAAHHGRVTTCPTPPWTPTGRCRSVDRQPSYANQFGRPGRALAPLSGLERTTTNT